MLEALQVIIKNTQATHQAIVNSQNATVAALHAAASGGGPTAAAAQAQLNQAGNNPLAGYTLSPAGHVPGSGATQEVGVSPVQGGASTGYSVPPAAVPAPPQQPPGGGGGATGGGGGGGGGGQGPAPAPQGGQGPAQQGQPGNLRGRVQNALPGSNATTPMGIIRQGGISGAIGLISDIYKTAVGVTEDASRYQGMEGGSTRLHGAHELVREKGYGLTTRAANPNGLTGQEAMQAFADVTSMGYRDDAPRRGQISRGAMLDFFQRNKTNMGMNENESLSVANAAITNGAVDSAEGLEALSKALHQVSDAAGAAGVNALLARQNFLTMFQGLTNAGAGTGATALAAAGTTSLAQYGRSMQNIDTSVQFGEQFQFRAAAHSGMSVGAYQNLLRTDPGAAQGVVDQMTSRGINNAIGAQAVEWIKQQAKKYGGPEGVSNDPTLLQQLADDYQQAFKPNLIRLMQVIQNTTGVQVEEGQVTKWVVGHVLGLNASGKINQTGRAAEGSAVVQSGGKTTAAGGGAANTASMQMLAPTGSGNTGQERTAGGRGLNAGQQAYFDYTHSQGKAAGYHDPVIEKMLGAVKDQKNTKVLVHHQGGSRLVSVADAIKYFPNEIAAGQVSFVDKDKNVTNFAEQVGVEGDSSRSTTNDATRTDVSKIGTKIADDDPLMKKAAEANDKHTGSDSSQAGMLGLTPEAAKLVRLLGKPESPTAEDAASGSRPHPGGATNWIRRMSAP